ncbi:MAG TPA: ATP-grasp domain-containing protein [Candidatus Saccharibacteria bacterium]|nr:ATP-grasp domain-containing protein [Candidatus Saccharibacteria bacterium]
MAHVLIIGKSFSGLKNFLVQHGHTYTILQDELATKFPEKKFKHRVVCSFRDESSYLAAAHKVHDHHPVDAVITIYENYIVAGAVVATALGLPGLTKEAALACTDKEIMRGKFALSTEKVSPDFQVVDSRESLTDFATSHTFPLILKPANLAKSLLVTKNDSLDELLANYDKALNLTATTYKKYAPNSTPKFIVEEFLEGSIHSVDAFVDAHGEPHVLEQVVDYQTGHDIGFDDNFHYSRLLPSQLSDADVAAIRHTAKLGCKLLGMTSSPAHVEIILTRDGPRIVEIGARNGGYRERMHRLANDIDITKNALALALNKPLAITAKKNASVGVFELFPKVPGAFAGISHQAELEQLASLDYLSIKARPGHFVGKSSDGHKMTAIVILHNDDADQFAQDMQYMNQFCAVQTTTL